MVSVAVVATGCAPEETLPEPFEDERVAVLSAWADSGPDSLAGTVLCGNPEIRPELLTPDPETEWSWDGEFSPGIFNNVDPMNHPVAVEDGTPVDVARVEFESGEVDYVEILSDDDEVCIAGIYPAEYYESRYSG